MTMQWTAAMTIALLVSVSIAYECSAIEEDMDYDGYDIRSTTQVRAEDCCKDCFDTNACVLLVWTNGTCWLKSSTSGKPSRAFGKRVGYVHRSDQCGPILDNTDYTYYYSVDLGSTFQSRAEACCSDCANWYGCAAWVWYNDSVWMKNGVAGTGTCYLKSLDAAMSNRSKTARPGRRAAELLHPLTTRPSITFPSRTSDSSSGVPTTILIALGFGVFVACMAWCYKYCPSENTPPATPNFVHADFIEIGRRRQDLDGKSEHLWRCNICAFENASDKDGCRLCETTRGIAFESHDQLNAVQHSAWARNAWSRVLNKYDQRPMWTQRSSHVFHDNTTFYVIGAAVQPAHEDGAVMNMESTSDRCDRRQVALTWQRLTRECASVAVDGSVLPLTWFNEPDESGSPRAIPFQEKLATMLIYFTHTVMTTTKFNLHRDALWTESLEALLLIRPESFASKTKIKFLGEDGVDAGGIQREWYSLMAHAFLDHELFVVHANRMLGLNPLVADPTHFLALGRFLARAIIDGQVLPLSLTAPLFKALLGTPLSIHDVRYIDEMTYKSLLFVRDTDCIEALDLDFTWTLPDGRSVELVAGGADVAVTSANQAEYVACLVRYWLFDSVRTPLEHVVRGFYDVVDPVVIANFDYKELELVLCGTTDINVVEWQFETVVTANLTASPALAWFWDVVERDMHQHDRAKLLQFTTGSARVPLQGFKALTGHDGNLCPFTLRGVPYTKGAMPKVQTCFNRILLPLYPSRKLMREALFVLVNMEIQDFTMQ
ncbi:hypothetical protein H310_07899 [Aphanomyces invadans]|uniref:HECT-type E3 ubiquitin transferase n=1 Tax=Aphanomyces invadans TaxID=157072 RepID=A0A024U0X8_9STRA|nr:hypothetical protein H310_07899 [Aphanomyces invadans]ETV99864.1 hypothetical protein H310_07899 [Aphanomyces invadans]|eukprot:XP_008871640.1 hypothetical protein H310_07899 [Aphanomyces invadans]